MKSRAAAFLMMLIFACTSHPATSATRFVWQNSPNPGPPYDSWDTAAHVIQDAVDAAHWEPVPARKKNTFADAKRAIRMRRLGYSRRRVQDAFQVR